jgi:hypothetical protein
MKSNIIELPNKQPVLFLIIAASIWLAIYQVLIPLSELIVLNLPVERDGRFGSALQFFFYDAPKVLMLFTGRST